MTEDRLKELFIKYPHAEITDVFKYLHQSCFGCEHLCPSYEAAYDRIISEYECNSYDPMLLTEPLDGEYTRVYLSYLDRGLAVSTLARLFVMSSRKEKKGVVELEARLDRVRELIKEGRINFDINDFSLKRSEWKDKGYSALHHSDSYRNEYKPAYRVISNDFIPFIPLFCEIDKKLRQGSVRLAVEGGSASGKSTLGNVLKEVYGCTLFHMDDYFLRPEQRTPERFAEPGGNVDRERFLSEILVPMSTGEDVIYRPYNCSKGALDDPIKAQINELTVTEGAYSMHPELAPYYSMSVFLDINADKQRERIEKRNPTMKERFFNEWIPLEQKYFEAFGIKKKCDFVIEI